MGTRPLCVWCRKRKVDVAYRPFCSERCKMADLGQWLSGAYRVPGPPHAEASSGDEEDEPLDPSQSTPH